MYDELELLGYDAASGEDFVGAGPIMSPSAHLTATAAKYGGGGMTSAAFQASKARALMQLGAKVAAQSSKQNRMRQLAYAGMLPQIPLGVRDNSVAAGATETISPEPGVPLRITQFYASPTIAGLFLVTQITVARVNMLAGSDGVPATLFTPEARRPPFENPILAAGSQIVVGVENIDVAAHPFFGAFMGIDLTPPYARYV